ncbi:class I SAM-dependent methyltransferase [Candidatus Puniceispirillum sp.]|nr:class I SAM-dependent methyltransferase [Candidatus Puniceispirillum sp.]
MNLAPSCWIMQQAERWPNGSKIIDFASGHGRHSRALSAAFPDRFEILATDHNHAALKELAAQFPGVKTLQTDLENTNIWPFAAHDFDVVLVTNYLFRPRLPDLFQLIRNGGFLAYETFAEGNGAYGRPSNPNFLLKDGELQACLPDDFKILDYFHGKIDQPQPAVIQRLAAKRR